jgi:hypothetical protein
MARGDDRTRFITLRNLGWNPIKINVRLDGEIGLTSKGRVELRQYHPSEQVLGTFEYGDSIPVTVDPFRACLVMATVAPVEEIGVTERAMIEMCQQTGRIEMLKRYERCAGL